MEKRIIVSIHDISPKFKSELEAILNRLKEINVTEKELLVVLDWEGRYNLENDKWLIGLLKKERKNGSGIGLHGLTHYGTRRGFLERILFGNGSDKVPEFKGLNYSDSAKRLKKSVIAFKRIFRQYPKVFIPSQWKHTKNSLEASRKLNIIYSESLTHLINLKNGKKKASFVCCFDFGNNKLINRALRIYSLFAVGVSTLFNLPLRYSIHPNDVNNGNFNFEAVLLKSLINRGWTPTLSENLWKRA